MLEEVKTLNAKVKVILNSVEQPIIFAKAFHQVLKGEIFAYSDSLGVIGSNPSPSKRYVELLSNGLFGKFGVNFFENEGKQPRSGQIIYFKFEYPLITSAEF